MGRAQSLIKKVDSLLKKFAPPERTIYKRTVTLTGDELTGHTASTVVDTLMSPQPYFHRVGREHLPGGHAIAQDLVDASGTINIADDYEFVISPTAMSRVEIQNPAMQLVAKDTAGNVEVFRILDTLDAALSDTDVLYTVYARSVKRP